MVTLLKKFKTQGDSLTLPGTVLVQTPLLQESHTPQQQTCPSQKAQAHHFQHPDWKEYTATGNKNNQRQRTGDRSSQMLYISLKKPV